MRWFYNFPLCNFLCYIFILKQGFLNLSKSTHFAFVNYNRSMLKSNFLKYNIIVLLLLVNLNNNSNLYLSLEILGDIKDT